MHRLARAAASALAAALFESMSAQTVLRHLKTWRT